ncbi:MAG: CapA family protein [Prevotellaceae bacterium]|jgi:poly-gamma-glutamate synthesis protein (capsule biosynthesis protein)|nr:CapA family protein [Prevotellaceae bacterium]
MRFLPILILLLLSLEGYTQDTLTLVFAGDVMQHKAQIDAAKQSSGYDYSTYFTHVQKYIESSDIAIANLEVTLAGEPYTGYPQFSAPDELAIALKEAGFDILLTANNHTCDKGKSGVTRTIDMLDSLRILHTGTFRSQAQRDSLYPMIIDVKGFRLAILNYTYGTNGFPTPPSTVVNRIDTVQMATDIAVARAMQPDIIMAGMHWGDEYKLYPNVTQQKLAEFLIRQGVSLIIGSHPHVLQRMERRLATDGSTRNVVLYSLGNYISNMSAKNTDGGVMAHIRLVKDSSGVCIDECSYRFVWTYKPPVNGRKTYTILPIADFERTPDELSPADFKAMTAFVARMRALYDKESTGFTECL